MRYYNSGITSKITPQTAWDALSLPEKAEMMKVAVSHGIMDLKEIRDRYNEYAAGGSMEDDEEQLPPITPFKQRTEVIITPDQEYNQYLNTLPDNQRFTPNEAYDSYFYWKLNSKPKNFEEAYNKGMFHFDHSDGGYHANSIQFGDDGIGYFMKPKTHDTVGYETDWYNKGIVTEEGGRRRFVTDKERQELEDFRRRFELIDDPNRPNFFMYAPRNVEAKGGGIHIKPENRGKFTALKERTGHSATWFKEHGTPAQKKMAVFALNTRKWKHGEGGNLFDGESQDTNQMQIGRNYWQSTPTTFPFLNIDFPVNGGTLQEVVVTGKDRRKERLARLEELARKRQNDYLTTSNDNTWVENALIPDRVKNPHLAERALEGAKQHRRWNEDHPIASAIGMGIETIPLAIAAAPLIGATVESAPAVASALAPGSAFWTNPITQQVAASTLGGTALNAASEVTTGKTWDEHTNETIEGLTGWNPENDWYGGLVTGLFNPGYYTPYGAVANGTARAIEGVSPINRAVKNTADNIERRAIETGMRSSPYPVPFPYVRQGFKSMMNGEEGGRGRLLHILDYIATGRRVGPNGYYNSFAYYQPYNEASRVANPTFKQKWEEFTHPIGESKAYSGFVDSRAEVAPISERKDMIDAFLYGEEIDPSFGLRRVSIGEDFGHHADYVSRKYPSKAHDIQVYEVNTPEAVPESEVTPFGDWHGVENGVFETGKGENVNVAGHRRIKGKTSDSSTVAKMQDIWKFEPEEYYKRWLESKRPYEELSPFEKNLVRIGLKEVDRLGTPVITRTKWSKWGWL